MLQPYPGNATANVKANATSNDNAKSRYRYRFTDKGMFLQANNVQSDNITA